MMRGFHAVSLLAFVSLGQAFYLPGSAPIAYSPGDEVEVFVNAITANDYEGSLQSLVEYEYYDPEFHNCLPSGGPKKQPESLGSILFGDRIYNSAFDVKMLENKSCALLCRKQIPGPDAKWINKRIEEGYSINLLIDGLPGAEKFEDANNEVWYKSGIALGNTNDGGSINTHYDIYLEYHPRPDGTNRVVGVLVWPSSNPAAAVGKEPDCAQTHEVLKLKEGDSDVNEVDYTYTITWIESSTPWATRFDHYLRVWDKGIHWFSLFNSVFIVVVLISTSSALVARKASHDISRYNAVDSSDDLSDETGWKLIHSEVFRAPPYKMALSVSIGNGAQLSCMAAVTLVFALLGFLTPSNRGSLATTMIIFYTIFGFSAGYASARAYSTLGGDSWRLNTLVTAVSGPAVAFGSIFILNLIAIFSASAGAVPFGTLLFILLLWCGISIPLTVAGSHFGNKKGAISVPTKTAMIPRQIPPITWWLKPVPNAMLAGLMPFGAAFIELYFILSSLFGSRVYVAFGFLFLTTAISLLTTMAVSILITYLLLVNEEYRWQWRSFSIGIGSGAWTFLYGLYFMSTRLQLNNAASIMLYLGYLSLISLMVSVVLGSVAALSAFWVVRKLYSSVRID